MNLKSLGKTPASLNGTKLAFPTSSFSFYRILFIILKLISPLTYQDDLMEILYNILQTDSLFTTKSNHKNWPSSGIRYSNC